MATGKSGSTRAGGETPYADEFVRSLNRIRELRRISLSELAAMTGVSKGYLSNLTNGGHGVSLEYAMRIATALNQPIIAMVTPQYDALLDRAAKSPA